MVGKIRDELPPGFRFHPTDEELIVYYLRNQATSRPCPVSIIPEIDIYKFDPWDLPEKSEFGENEWYFFSPRDRKYPNGVRPNRAAVSGYWKATGTDKAIHSGSKYVGVKKALVFYKGRPPKGTKTDWIMHEYRLSESRSLPLPVKQNGSMRLDDWVLCRIYKKKNAVRVMEPKAEDYVVMENGSDDNETQGSKFPRNCSISHLWELDYLGSISQILSENPYIPNSDTTAHNPINNGGGLLPRDVDKIQSGGTAPPHHTDSLKFQLGARAGTGGVFLNHQPIFVNPSLFEFPPQAWS